MSVVVEVDSRRRVSLGRLGKPEHTRYLAEVEPDGTIVLTPAVVMSAIEARVLADRDLVDRISTELASNKRVRNRPRRRD